MYGLIYSPTILAFQRRSQDSKVVSCLDLFLDIEKRALLLYADEGHYQVKI